MLYFVKDKHPWEGMERKTIKDYKEKGLDQINWNCGNSFDAIFKDILSIIKGGVQRQSLQYDDIQQRLTSLLYKEGGSEYDALNGRNNGDSWLVYQMFILN
jgi:hypothetical protein